MTDTDFEEVASLWRQPPSVEEDRAFQSLARRASLKARLLRKADFGIALLLILAVAVALGLRPAPASLAIGILTIAGIGWSSWKRHLLGRMAASVESADRRDLVRVAATNVSADLRRSNMGLWLLFPGVLLGALLGHSLKQSTLDGFGRAFWEGVTDWPWGFGSVAVIFVAFSIFIRGNRRMRRELERLRVLERQYEEEARLDASGMD